MSERPVILLVEDDENMRLGLQDNLEEQGYSVLAVSDAAGARERLREAPVALVLLDVMLPDGDGYQLCEALRAEGRDVRILMLTARSLEQDVVRGFDAGADDYVSKPYRLAELLARVRALLRRGGDPRSSEWGRFGGHRLDAQARSVRGPDGSTVDLTRTEFDLLALFLQNAGRALHRQEILDVVWGEDVVVDGRTVDNFVSSLKRKLSWRHEAPWRITTIRSVGYRFEVD